VENSQDKFNVEIISEQCLSLLEKLEYSPSTLKSYRYNGYTPIIRHFKEQGISDITTTMLDLFVLDQHNNIKYGELSLIQWHLIHRCSKILINFLETGSVKIHRLKSWVAALQKSPQSLQFDVPTSSQLANNDDIFALEWKTLQEIAKLGLHQINIYKSALNAFLHRHFTQGLELYSESIVSEVVSEMRDKYNKGHISKMYFQAFIKASTWLSDMHKFGKITYYTLSPIDMKKLTPLFANYLQLYIEDCKNSQIYADSSIKTMEGVIRIFLFELEDCGFSSFELVINNDIINCINRLSEHCKLALGGYIVKIRQFLKRIFELNLISSDLSQALPNSVAPRRKIKEGFTTDEIKLLLKQPDLNTLIGKRNYAIMVLATQTGLRGCDIANLKRQDIDWHNKTISIIQLKTGKPLTLKLEPESGNAIADYLSSRLYCALPYIFLSSSEPYRPLSTSSFNVWLKKYLDLANMSSSNRNNGFHNFRRSFALRLLENGSPIEQIAELLGQFNVDSAKRYLSIHEEKLKECALGLINNMNNGVSL
jgi:site-specific recombinase XerD